MAESDSTADGNILQFGEVLQGADAHAQDAALLHFSYDAASNATIVEVKSDAGAPAETTIIVSGVNLTSLGGDGDIISHLLSSWTAHVD